MRRLHVLRLGALSEGASSADSSSSLSSSASPPASCGFSSASSASPLLALAVVGILAQLVAVAEIGDHLPREPGEGLLVVEHPLDPGERPAGMRLEDARARAP